MKQLDLLITDIASSGHGTAEHQTYGLVHVLGAFPGDRVMVSIYKTIGLISYAEIVSFNEYSPWRNTKPTKKPFFSANMPWQYLSIEAENTYKGKLVSDLYDEYLNTDIEIASQEVNREPLLITGYRNKVAYSFMNVGKKKDQLAFALYTRGINGSEKIPQTENLLVHPLLEKAGKQFLQFFNQKNIRLREIKYLILRYSYFENRVVAHVLFPEANRKKLPFKKSDLELFIKNKPEIAGVSVSHSERGVRSAITTKDFYSVGNIDITERVLDKKYSYSPALFFQIYPKAFEEILIDLRAKILEIKNHDELPVLDLFAGVGLIGLEISDLVKHVTGVELSSASKYYARKNAKKNNIDNYSFMETDVDEALSQIESEQILIVDPTRAGLSKQTIETIIEQKPEYIFYISCNPESQFENYQSLSELYEIKFIKSYNIFPKTHHVESMIVLRKK